MMTYLGARANPFCTSPGHTHQPAGLPYRASARSMVSFHSQCRGVKFYDVCITGTEWGTKLKLVKEPTTPPRSTVYHGLGPWDKRGIGSEKNWTLGPKKKRMVCSEKNRSNSKTGNTPWYLCATEQLIIILACVELNIEYLSWISLTNRGAVHVQVHVHT